MRALEYLRGPAENVSPVLADGHRVALSLPSHGRLDHFLLNIFNSEVHWGCRVDYMGKRGFRINEQFVKWLRRGEICNNRKFYFALPRGVGF
jgi:hypothetical protein